MSKKVLMLTYNDWANTGYRTSKCLELLGYDVTFYKGQYHKFGYLNQGEVHPAIANAEILERYPVHLVVRELRELVEQADIIHFIGSTYIETGVDLRNKNVVVNHGGSTFRLNPQNTLMVFNEFVDYSIIQCPDLLGLGAKNEALIYYPIDTNYIKPTFNKMGENGKLVIGHFPSSPDVKGTLEIMQTLAIFQSSTEYKDKIHIMNFAKEQDDNYAYMFELIPWIDNLVRMSKCDIIIETMNLSQNGRKFGEWGNTALEACALGKILITNSLSRKIYKSEYGIELPLLIANTKEELANVLERVLDMSDDELMQTKIGLREWAEKYHSMEATAKRIYDKVYCHFE